MKIAVFFVGQNHSAPHEKYIRGPSYTTCQNEF